MASIRKNALTGTKTLLDTIATLRSVTDDHTTISKERLPGAWVSIGADEERDIHGTLSGNIGFVRASVNIRLIGIASSTQTTAENLEDLSEEVVAGLIGNIATFQAMDPPVSVVAVSIITDPDEDVARETSILTVGVEFAG